MRPVTMLVKRVNAWYSRIPSSCTPGGGTRYVKVMGRLRGIDPPFSRHWEKI